jgi:hypothetical protein
MAVSEKKAVWAETECSLDMCHITSGAYVKLYPTQIPSFTVIKIIETPNTFCTKCVEGRAAVTTVVH